MCCKYKTLCKTNNDNQEDGLIGLFKGNDKGTSSFWVRCKYQLTAVADSDKTERSRSTVINSGW